MDEANNVEEVNSDSVTNTPEQQLQDGVDTAFTEQSDTNISCENDNNSSDQNNEDANANSEKKTYKHPGGRKTVMTPETIGKLEQAFAYGATDSEACFFAGIHPTTLYDYCVIHPEFRDRKEALKDSPILKARRAVIEAMEADPNLAFKYLERKRKDEFGPRTELTGANGQNLVPDSKNELNEVIGLLKNATDSAIREAEPDASVADNEEVCQSDS